MKFRISVHHVGSSGFGVEAEHLLSLLYYWRTSKIVRFAWATL